MHLAHITRQYRAVQPSEAHSLSDQCECSFASHNHTECVLRWRKTNNKETAFEGREKRRKRDGRSKVFFMHSSSKTYCYQLSGWLPDISNKGKKIIFFVVPATPQMTPCFVTEAVCVRLQSTYRIYPVLRFVWSHKFAS